MPTIPRLLSRPRVGRSAIALAVGAAALAAAASPALGQSEIPPEADEYVPTVPDSEGDKPLGRKGDGGDGDALDPAVAEELGQLGADGEAVAELTRATAPRNDRANAGSATDDDSAVGAVAGTLAGDSSGGVGLLLPLVLLGALAAFVVYAVRRRRAGGK